MAYQFAELEEFDLGGGGTIAYIMANYGMEVIDSGSGCTEHACSLMKYQAKPMCMRL